MSEQASEPVDELGPVDWIVVEFPGSRFKGEIAPALGELVERGIVRVLDLLLIRKGEDGTLDFHELSDLDESEIGGLRAYEGELATLLSEDDVTAAAAPSSRGAPQPCWCGRTPGPPPSGRPCAARAGSWWPAGGSRCRHCSPRSSRTRDKETDMPLAARRRRGAGTGGTTAGTGGGEQRPVRRAR